MSGKTHPAGPVYVWDLATRLFHWLLVALVALAAVTGAAQEASFAVHKLAGIGILLAILFRLVWGFVGGRHSRFRDFLHPWPVVRDHARGLLALRPQPTLGHNPLGGWMIVLLLAVLLGMVGTGVLALEDGVGGLLARSVSPQVPQVMEELHGGLFILLLLLVGVHVGGVLINSVLTGHRLVRAMITGWKEPIAPDLDAMIGGRRPASYWYEVLALGATTGAAWLLVA